MQDQQLGLENMQENLPDGSDDLHGSLHSEPASRRGLAGLKTRLRRWLADLLSQIHPGGISMMDL